MAYITVGPRTAPTSSCTTRTTDRPAGRAHPRLPARRRSPGRSRRGAARGRLPGHHLRPPRIRPVEQGRHGYDYDTFAADLNTLLETLDLHDVVLVGFSMGTGEVARYVAHLRPRAGREGRLPRVARAVPAADRRQPRRACRRRSSTASPPRPRPTATPGSPASSTNFYNLDENLGTPHQPGGRRASWNVAVGGAPVAAYAAPRPGRRTSAPTSRPCASTCRR